MKLSIVEKEFMMYWENQRKKERKVLRKILWGVPTGIIFSSVILINIMSGWDKQVYKIPMSLFVLIIIGLIALALFTAFFKMQIDWQRKEQYYLHLQQKQQLED